MKILFITSTRIGDAVLSTGLLAHFIKRFPDARITIACGTAPAPLFRDVPGVEKVIPMVKRKRAGHWFALWRQCIGTQWGLIVDLRKSGIAYGLRTRLRIVPKGGRSEDHKVVELGKFLIQETPPAPQMWISAEAANEAAALLPGGTPILAFGPTANWLPKMWPAENFVALARALTDPGGILPGARVAVFGGPGENHLAAPVLAGLPSDRTIDLVGKAGLSVTAAMIARSTLYIGNDSGLMHIAAATGVPTLGLFGPSPASRYAPWGAHTAVAQTDVPFLDLVTGPAFNHRDDACLMESLSVDSAAAAAAALWARVQEDVA